MWKDTEKSEGEVTEENQLNEIDNLYKDYKKETGNSPIRGGKETKVFQRWKETKKSEEKVTEKSEEKVTEKSEEKKEKIDNIPRTWKDEVTKSIDENLEAFVKDLRKDLKDFIINLKTEKTVLENKLLELDEHGFICILYGIPGIGKSTFCASGVLDNYKVVFLDLTNQGRRLKQYEEIYKSPLFLYEPIDEKDEFGDSDLSKNFELLTHRVIQATYTYKPDDVIIVIDGWSKAISHLNSYLRKDILVIGDPKRGRQSDVPYGDWYWRTLRYSQLLFSLETAANRGFKIFLTAEVKEVTEITKDERGRLKIYKTGERAPNVRADDLYTSDIEAFFRYSYDAEKDIVGPREIEIKSSKVPGINEGTVLIKPKIKTFIELKGSFKKLEFGV